MKLSALLLFIIIGFGFTLRIYQIDKIPSGFYSDESLVGYEAYSILKTGKDQYGNVFPAFFKAFGDYRPGLFIYGTVPFIWALGLNEFSTRIPSVVFSTANILIIYLLAKILFKSEKVALLSGFIFSISPWSIQFARMSHDTNLSTLIITSSIYFFVKAQYLRQRKLLIFSILLLALSFYAYYTPRVFVPFYILFCTFIIRNKLKEYKREFIIGIIGAIIILTPFIGTLLNREAGWSRIDAVNIWSDPGLVAKTESLVHEDILMTSGYPRLFHNKFITIGLALLRSFTSHFTPDFLLFSGDPVKIYQTPENGILLFVEPLLIIFGVIILWRKLFVWRWFLCFWFLTGLLPDTFTRLYPAAARIQLSLPIVSMLGSVGLWHILFKFKGKKYSKVFLTGILSILFAYNLVYFFHFNFVHAPLRYAKEWHYGIRELVETIKPNLSQYDEIWLSKRTWGWINIAFYLKYPPQNLQQEISLSAKNEFGLGWVYGFGKFHFDDIPKEIDYSKNTLYVGERNEFPAKSVPEKIIYYPDKSEAFIIISTEQLKELSMKEN